MVQEGGGGSGRGPGDAHVLDEVHEEVEHVVTQRELALQQVLPRKVERIVVAEHSLVRLLADREADADKELREVERRVVVEDAAVDRGHVGLVEVDGAGADDDLEEGADDEEQEADDDGDALGADHRRGEEAEGAHRKGEQPEGQEDDERVGVPEVLEAAGVTRHDAADLSAAGRTTNPVSLVLVTSDVLQLLTEESVLMTME